MKNPVAKALRSPRYRASRIESKKGYNRGNEKKSWMDDRVSEILQEEEAEDIQWQEVCDKEEI